MTEKKDEKLKLWEAYNKLDPTIKKDRVVVTFDRKEIQGTGFKTLPVKKSKYVKPKED